MRIAYMYVMRPDTRVAELAPKHAAYWQARDLPQYKGGPFEDRSGGLIVFEAESLHEARRLMASDPFVVHGLLASSLLKQWSVEPIPAHT